MPTVREVTHALLRALGMTTIFGNPGSTEEPFLQDFPPDFTYVLGLQEAAVLGIADGFAQATGRAAFVNLHTAPGVGNALGNLATAWHNKTPLVVTAGQQVRPMLTLEAWLINRAAVEFPNPYVKWSVEPPRPQAVPATLERAYHLAMQPPQGPVFVSIPMDDWDAPAEPHTPRTVSYRHAPDPAALEQAAARLRASQRLAVVVGGGVDRAGGWEAAVALAERLRAAVFAAPATERVGFPEDHPLFQGYAPYAIAPLAERLRPFDMVLVAGAPVFRYYPYVPGAHLPAGTDLIQLTDDPDEAARAPVGTAVVGDVGLALAALAEQVPAAERPAPPPLRRPEPPAASGEAISPDVLMAALARAVPDDAAFCLEAPSHAGAFHAHVPITRPGSYFSTASGGLGFAMPAAVGVQLAQPERPVVCLIGDGSVMYCPQALWTAVQQQAPAVFVVTNNGHYGILKAFAGISGTQGIPGLDLPGLDLVKLAEGFGCPAHRVASPAALEPTLRAAFAAARRDRLPQLVDVLVDATLPRLV